MSKHDAYQRELKSEMDRLEEKMKTQMEEEEKAMRDKLKKLNQQNAKSSHAIETMRQQVRLVCILLTKRGGKGMYSCLECTPLAHYLHSFG